MKPSVHSDACVLPYESPYVAPSAPLYLSAVANNRVREHPDIMLQDRPTSLSNLMSPTWSDYHLNHFVVPRLPNDTIVANVAFSRNLHIAVE